MLFSFLINTVEKKFWIRLKFIRGLHITLMLFDTLNKYIFVKINSHTAFLTFLYESLTVLYNIFFYNS